MSIFWALIITVVAFFISVYNVYKRPFCRATSFVFSLVCVIVFVYCIIKLENDVKENNFCTVKKEYKVELWYLGGFKDTVYVQAASEKDLYCIYNRFGLYKFCGGNKSYSGVVNFKILNQDNE